MYRCILLYICYCASYEFSLTSCQLYTRKYQDNWNIRKIIHWPQTNTLIFKQHSTNVSTCINVAMILFSRTEFSFTDLFLLPPLRLWMEESAFPFPRAQVFLLHSFCCGAHNVADWRCIFIRKSVLNFGTFNYKYLLDYNVLQHWEIVRYLLMCRILHWEIVSYQWVDIFY